MNDIVRLRQSVFNEILNIARCESGNECCGLLAGNDGIVSVVLAARNALQSSDAYEIAPHDLFMLFRGIRAAGLQHLGIYHSHPRGENVPSRRDLASAFYPDVAYLIVSLATNVSRPVRAFRIRDGMSTELALHIVP